MQVTKTLIAAAGNAGGASGALYTLNDATKTTSQFSGKSVRIDSSDNIYVQIQSYFTGATPFYNPVIAKFDQDGNVSFMREYYDSGSPSDGFFVYNNCMAVGTDGDVHWIMRYTNGSGLYYGKVNGSNGNWITGSRAAYTNNIAYSAVEIPANSPKAIGLFAKQGGTPNNVFTMFSETSDAYNAFTNKAWVQSSLNGSPLPAVFDVIPSWVTWHFSSPYAPAKGIFCIWTTSAGLPGYEYSFDINNSAGTISSVTDVYPITTVAASHDVNSSYTFCQGYDNSSGGSSSANIHVIQTDSFFSSVSSYEVFGRYAATGQTHTPQIQGAVRDNFTGGNYIYLVLYVYDSAISLNCPYILCFDSVTGSIIKQINIKDTSSSQSVFATTKPVLDSEGNVYFMVEGQTARSTKTSVVKLPPGLEISDATVDMFDFEEVNEFASQGTSGIANFYDFSAPTSGWGYGSNVGTQTTASKTLNVTTDVI